MNRTALLALFSIAMLLPHAARADDASPLKELQQFNAYIERDNRQPGKPVIAIYVHSPQVTDALAERLKDFKKLERVGLNGTSATDTALQALKGLKDLHTLNLHGTRVTDAGLK